MKYLLEEKFILLEANDPSDDPREGPVVQGFNFAASGDWDDQYEACKTTEDYKAFWERYVKEIFKESASKAYGLIPALAKYLPNCEEGWEPTENPIINLLVNLGKKGLSKISISSVNVSSLNALTNALKDNQLSAQIITDSIKATTAVVLNTPDFYAMTYTDQAKYLALQAKVYKSEKSQWVQNFGKACTAGGKLLPVKKASKNVKAMLNISTEETTEMSTDTANTLGQKVSSDEALVAFAAVYDIFNVVSPQGIEAVATKFGGKAVLEKVRSKVTLSGEQATKWRQVFLPKNTKYTKESVVELLSQLLNKLDIQPKQTQKETNNVL